MDSTKKTSFGEETVNTLLMPFFKQRTHAVVHPFKIHEKPTPEPKPFYIQVFDYNLESLTEQEIQNVDDCFEF